MFNQMLSYSEFERKANNKLLRLNTHETKSNSMRFEIWVDEIDDNKMYIVQVWEGKIFIFKLIN
jgi:hypothetical protein